MMFYRLKLTHIRKTCDAVDYIQKNLHISFAVSDSLKEKGVDTGFSDSLLVL